MHQKLGEKIPNLKESHMFAISKTSISGLKKLSYKDGTCEHLKFKEALPRLSSCTQTRAIIGDFDPNLGFEPIAACL